MIGMLEQSIIRHDMPIFYPLLVKAGVTFHKRSSFSLQESIPVDDFGALILISPDLEHHYLKIIFA